MVKATELTTASSKNKMPPAVTLPSREPCRATTTTPAMDTSDQNTCRRVGISRRNRADAGSTNKGMVAIITPEKAVVVSKMP